MASKADYRRIVAHLLQLGYIVRQGKRSGHHKVFGADGRFIASFPGTPSDWRSYQNTVSSLRRAGVPDMPSTRHLPKAKR